MSKKNDHRKLLWKYVLLMTDTSQQNKEVYEKNLAQGNF